MTQEVKLNLDIDGKVKISDYSFTQSERASYLFRLIKNNYPLDMSLFNSLTIVFRNSGNTSQVFTTTVTNSNIVTVNNEKLVRVQLPDELLKVDTIFSASPTIKITNSNKTLPAFSLVVYKKDSAEMNYVRQVIGQLNEAYGLYSNLIKKDILDTANGVAITDSNNKILEEYLPPSYNTHINTNIATEMVHGLGLNSDGKMIYYDPADTKYKLVQNQFNPNSPTIPPLITVIDNVVTVNHDPTTLLSLQKWEYNEINNIEYFQNYGNLLDTKTFLIDKAGRHTLYYKISDGNEYLVYFNITQDMPQTHIPDIQVFDGLLTIEFESPIPMNIIKIAAGVKDKSYFDENGFVIIDGRYPITSIGKYTIYWKEDNGHDYITTIDVSQGQIHPHTPPTISVKGVFTVNVEYTSEVEALVSLKKWEEGDRDTDWFNENGHILKENIFFVNNSGINTYYYKYRNRDFVTNFFIVLPPDVSTKFGVTKVVFDSTQNDSDFVIKKWDVGARNIEYFRTEGNSFTGSEFNVTEVGEHTLYVKDIFGGEHIFTFFTTQNNLETPIINISILDGLATVTYSPDYYNATFKKWDVGRKNIEWFDENGIVITGDSFTVTEVGEHTLYYVLEDVYPFEYVFNVNSNQISNEVAIPFDIWGMDKRFIFEWNFDDEMPEIARILKGIKTISDFNNGSLGTDVQLLDSTTRTVYIPNSIIDEDYTLYIKMSDGAEGVKVFKTTGDMIEPPSKPLLTIDGNTGLINIYDVAKEDKVIDNRWTRGINTVNWFEMGNGDKLNGDSFIVDNNGNVTLYYKYKTKAYTFTYDITGVLSIIDYCSTGDKLSLPDGSEYILLSDRYVIRRESIGIRAFDTGAGSQFNPQITTNIAYWLNNIFYNTMMTQAERDAVEENVSWNLERTSSAPSVILNTTISLPTQQLMDKNNAKSYMNSNAIWNTGATRAWAASKSYSDNRPATYFGKTGSSTTSIKDTTNQYNIFPVMRFKSGTRVQLQ